MAQLITLMNDELQQLQASLAVMRAELDDTKARLAKIEQVVTFHKGRDGKAETATIECTGLVVRQWDDRRFFAVHLGSGDNGGYIHVHYHGEEHGSKTAIGLGIQEDGEPHIQLRGKDCKIRADTFIDKDHDTMAVLAPNHAPGAVMRARPGGGSVSVLQPDGRARAVLIHDEFHKASGSDAVTPATDLIFATAQAKTVLKLNANADGGIVCVGRPGQADAAVIMARDHGATVMLHSPAEKTSVSIAATDGMARIGAHQGLAHDDKAEASLSAGAFGGSARFSDSDGTKRIDLHATGKSGTIGLLDDDDKTAVALSHHAGSHSSLEMSGVAEHDCVRIIANKDLSALHIAAPDSLDTGIITTAPAGKPMMTMMRKNTHPILMLGEGEQGGQISAFGPGPEKAGIASLTGGAVAGCFSVSTTDGTSLLTLDGTDHGGRLMINNDLGFQRIALGVHQESAGLHMNHTGKPGVHAVATPEGGLVCVCDAEGKPIDAMPQGDDDDPSARWGKLPGSE